MVPVIGHQNQALDTRAFKQGFLNRDTDEDSIVNYVAIKTLVPLAINV